MQLANEIKNEIKDAKKLRLSWRGKLYWGAACLIIIWLLDYFGRFDLALPTLNCIGVLGIIIVFKWKLRYHAWFWIAMAVIAACHVLLLLYIPWTTKWIPALAIGAIDSVDFVVVLTILTAVAGYEETEIH